MITTNMITTFNEMDNDIVKFEYNALLAYYWFFIKNIKSSSNKYDGVKDIDLADVILNIEDSKKNTLFRDFFFDKQNYFLEIITFRIETTQKIVEIKFKDLDENLQEKVLDILTDIQFPSDEFITSNKNKYDDDMLSFFKDKHSINEYEKNIIDQYLSYVANLKNLFIQEFKDLDNLDDRVNDIIINDKQKLFDKFYNYDRGVTEFIKHVYSYGDIQIESKHFYDACVHGDIEIAKWIYSLATSDIDVNYQKDINMFPNSEHLLTLCAEYGYFELAKWLISIGAKVDTENIAGLIMACGHGEFEIAKLYVEHGSPLFYTDPKLGYYSAFIHTCKNAVNCRLEEKDSFWNLINWLLTIYTPDIHELLKILLILEEELYELVDYYKDYNSDNLHDLESHVITLDENKINEINLKDKSQMKEIYKTNLLYSYINNLISRHP